MLTMFIIPFNYFSIHRISVAFSYYHPPLVTVLPHDITSTLVLRSPITTIMTPLSAYTCIINTIMHDLGELEMACNVSVQDSPR